MAVFLAKTGEKDFSWRRVGLALALVVVCVAVFAYLFPREWATNLPW